MKWTKKQLRRHGSRVRQQPPRRSNRPGVERLETRLAPANLDVTTYHYDNFLSGWNNQESSLTTAKVGNRDLFGQLFSQPVDGYVYATPLYRKEVPIGGAAHNVAFVATEHDSVYAFDTDTGSQL